MSAPRAVDPADRIVAIDVLRGAALFGVLAVNLVTEFRVSIFQQFLPGTGAHSAADRLAEVFVAAALESKAFVLFSFLFGVSLAILHERLSATGAPLYWLARRLLVLLAFGLIHLLFIWNGDILTEYAIAGLLVLPLLSLATPSLLACAAASFMLYLALPYLPLPIPWPSEQVLVAHVAAANSAYASGDYAHVWRFSLDELRFILLLHLYVFPRTLALFLVGVIAWRAGAFRLDRNERLLGIALAGLAIGGAISIREAAGMKAGLALSNIASVLLAAGYGATLLAIMQSGARERLARWFAPIGRMAFTNYLAQSVVFAWIFFGYGLGLFGRLGAFPVLAFGIAMFALQCWASAAWLRRFRFGPVEWLWRTLMYGQWQPMRREARL